MALLWTPTASPLQNHSLSQVLTLCRRILEKRSLFQGLEVSKQFLEVARYCLYTERNWKHIGPSQLLQDCLAATPEGNCQDSCLLSHLIQACCGASGPTEKSLKAPLGLEVLLLLEVPDLGNRREVWV